MKIILWATFVELLRQRFVHAIFFVAILLFFLSMALGSLSFAEQTRILVHFGFAAIQLAAVGISLFIGASVIPKEIERQTCLLILARPLTRAQYYFGKWAGAALLIGVVVSSLTVFLWILSGANLNLLTFLQVGFGSYLESLILLAMSFFFSLVLRPALTVFAGLGVFLFAHWLPDFIYFASRVASSKVVATAQVIHFLMPQLYRTNWRSYDLVVNNTLPGSEFLLVTMHAFGWTLGLLVLGFFVFRRKDLVA